MPRKKLFFLLFPSIPVLVAGIALLAATTKDMPANKNEQIVIGMLIQDSKSAAAKNGALMAVREANDGGGFRGMPFALAVKSMEGPWGTGSKQAVDLIFENKAVVLMGSHDGRNAHLVEQAATKARVAFVSCWSGDPTLSQAFVPVYFNLLPSYLQQSGVFADEIRLKGIKNGTLVISDPTYDSQQALKSLSGSFKQAGLPAPGQFEIKAPEFSSNAFDKLLASHRFGCIILLCSPENVHLVAPQLMKTDPVTSIFAYTQLMNEDQVSLSQWPVLFNRLLFPGYTYSSAKKQAFEKSYQRAYGAYPGQAAFYAYDAACLVIETIRLHGTDREDLIRVLPNASTEGVTGPIRFDAKGNRTTKLKLVQANSNPSMRL